MNQKIRRQLNKPHLAHEPQSSRIRSVKIRLNDGTDKTAAYCIGPKTNKIFTAIYKTPNEDN